MEKWIKSGVLAQFVCVAFAMWGAYRAENPLSMPSPTQGGEQQKLETLQKGPWMNPVWYGPIASGVLLAFSVCLFVFRKPKALPQKPESDQKLATLTADYEAKLLEARKPVRVPEISGEFSNVKILSHGVITKNEKQRWMKCGLSATVSLNSSSKVRIENIELRTYHNSPPCLSLSPSAQPQINELDGSSSQSFWTWPQIEYLYDDIKTLPESLHMVVRDEFGAEHLIYLKPGQTLPSLPGSSSVSAGQEAALVFDGFGPWKSPFTFGVPLGVQDLSVVTVRNNRLASAKEIHNVRARIEYMHDAKPTFAIERATWWSEQLTDQGTYRKFHRVTGVDLKANESQPFPVFMQGRTAKYPQSALDNDSETHDLNLGRWTAKITVTADFCEPLYGEIEFTVFQEGTKNTLSIGTDPPLGIVKLPADL